MLNPRLENPTAGNSCSYIGSRWARPGAAGREAAMRFVADEAASPGGESRSDRVSGARDLRAYGRKRRRSVVTRDAADATAERFGARLYGGRGAIGALAAVALVGLPHDVLLDPKRDVYIGWEPEG